MSIRFNDMFIESAFNEGCFVTAGDNPMVCSWGFVGVMWGKKLFIAPIRDSRFTKGLVDKSGEFGVSIPSAGTMKKELGFCGSKSGRDFDKWKETGLQKKNAQKIKTALVDGCAKYFECKVVGVLSMKGMDISAVQNWYPTDDLHNLFFGEIIAEY